MSDVVQRAKQALEGVTEGPWEVERWEDFTGQDVSYSLPEIAQCIVYRNSVDCGGDKALAEFIAAARSLVPELVTEVERLNGLLASSADEIKSLRKRLADKPKGMRGW